MSKSILVVDDEKLLRLSLRDRLEQEGYHTVAAGDGAEAAAALEKETFDLILLDYMLPDTDGLQILAGLREVDLETPVVMMTSHSSIDHAVTAMRAGATDYVAKPFDEDDLVLRLSRVLENAAMAREVRQYRQERKVRGGLKNMVGQSPALEPVFAIVERVLPSRDATVLIQGESGTGKDVLARGIHYEGARADGPFMNITCTALPETLLESELFGHEKGAFTDAGSQKKGLLELADGGTVFLDEIGDMSMYLQGKLLRFLEEKTIRRVGGTRDISLDVRIIAATNKDVKALVEKEKFREDLFFRLKVIPIRLPPLRERPEDIPLLVDHFIGRFNAELRREVRGGTPEFLKQLKRYPWPGNIRELKNTIERAMILCPGDQLDPDGLPLELFDDAPREVGTDGHIQLTERGVHLETLERDLVRQALELTKYNQTRAARLLGLNRDQIRYRIEKFDLARSKKDDD